MKGSENRQHFKYLSVGVEIAAGLSIPILTGYLIDRSWDTMPWFTILGILLGVATMLIIMISVARDVSGKNGD